MTSLADPASGCITIGVDTHHDLHVAAAVDHLGRWLATRSIPTTPHGYQQLLGWARGLGTPAAWGVEGTASYGAGLARLLTQAGQVVVEVNRPDRAARRPQGKSDPVDAVAAARAVLAGHASVIPKATTGQVEAIRALRIARAGAIKARTAATNALKALLVTAPADLRQQLRDLPAAKLVAACAALSTTTDAATADVATAGVQTAMASLATRIQALTSERTALDEQLDRLITRAAPRLLARFGVGTDCAGALLVAAGDNPTRLHTQAGFAARAAPAPCRPAAARPCGTGSTAAATARPTPPCTASWWSGCATTHQPRPT